MSVPVLLRVYCCAENEGEQNPAADRRSRMFALTSNGKEGTRAKGLMLSPNRRALRHASSAVSSLALLYYHTSASGNNGPVPALRAGFWPQ